MYTKVEVYACTKKEYDEHQEFRRKHPGKRPVCGRMHEADTYEKAMKKLHKGAYVYKVCYYRRNQLVHKHLEVLPWNIQW